MTAPNPPAPSPVENAHPASAFSLQRLSSAFARLMGAPPIAARPASSADGRSEEDDGDDRRTVTQQKIVEGLLFVGTADGTPLTSRAMAAVMRDVDAEGVDRLIDRLNEVYRESGAAYAIVRVDGGFRMQLREELKEQRRRLSGRTRNTRLSASAIETLAVVAYRQGISGAQVDLLRGARSHVLLAQLVRRQLLCIERDVSQAGSPTYFTTDRFRQLLRIQSLDELPRPAELDDFLAVAEEGLNGT